MTELQNSLPPGWDRKLDDRSGKYYYINHFTKTTTWEDPSSRHRPFPTGQRPFVNIQTEHIPLQHGSPSDLRRNYVYPSQTSPIIAFQMPTASPKSVPPFHQDLKPRMSPLSVKSSKVQDTSFTHVADTEEIVARISAMFPTVSETHIRILLKKYHGREALVVSVLQIEKHPITTPGPFATPPPQRNIQQPLRPPSASPAGSPREGLRSSPRAHSSPKLKLRYMKSVFPQADETIILELLQNNENNIQKTSDVLKEMGYERKDTIKLAQTKADAKKEQQRQQQQEDAEREERAKQEPSPSRMKTADEKRKMVASLQEKYQDVAEHLISIALESVHFDEGRANQILQIMIQEDAVKNEQEKEIEIEVVDAPSALSSLPVSQSRQSLKSLLKAEKEHEKFAFNRLIEENGEVDLNFRSLHLSNTAGPNPNNAKGANEQLLLENYVDWVGPNKFMRRGSIGLARGPDASLLSTRTYIARGPNEELRKGPKIGLAKGSIFTQLKSTLAGDSRGK